jgi:uncharacterized protein YfdQ (DUF2303 family)
VSNDDGELSENAALIAFAKEQLANRLIDIERGAPEASQVLILPRDLSVHSLKPLLDEYLTAPERKRGTAKLTSLASFIEHTNRFKDAESAVFADDTPKAPKLLSVLDYHAGGTGSPRFCEHRGRYDFPLSEAWAAWAAVDSVAMPQRQFAEFIEERVGDVLDPAQGGDTVWSAAELLGTMVATPAQLVELSRGLSVNVESKVSENVSLSSGEGRIRFETKHADAAGAPIKVPGGFGVAIPVFRGGPPYKIAVRLRYRVEPGTGRLTWTLKLYRTDLVFDHAFGEACDLVRKETGLPVFVGMPEQ